MLLKVTPFGTVEVSRQGALHYGVGIHACDTVWETAINVCVCLKDEQRVNSPTNPRMSVLTLALTWNTCTVTSDLTRTQ